MRLYMFLLENKQLPYQKKNRNFFLLLNKGMLIYITNGFVFVEPYYHPQSIGNVTG